MIIPFMLAAAIPNITVIIKRLKAPFAAKTSLINLISYNLLMPFLLLIY